MFGARAYLLDVTRRVPNRRTLEELVDILAAYRYNEFYLFAEKDFPEEEFDRKRLAMYCDIQGLAYHELKRGDFEDLFIRAEYVFASTQASRSLAGRVEDLRDGLAKAEKQGRERHVKGFMVTDFSDECAWEPLVVSLPGIIMGGHFASEGARAAMMDLERELDRTLRVPLGGFLLRLGTLYLRGGAPHDEVSELFNILSHDVGYSRHPGLTQFVLDDISGVARGIGIAAERWLDKSPWAMELAFAAKLVDTACHRRNEPMLRSLRDDLSRLWRARHTPDGRVEALMHLPRF